MKKINSNNVYVAKSQLAEGYGVFAARNLKVNQVAEICPAIFMPMIEFKEIEKTKLFYYLRRVMEVKAIKEIQTDEEIFINYNYYPEDDTPLESWFSIGVDKNNLG